MKKIISFCLVLVLVFSLSSFVNASDFDEPIIDIVVSNDDVIIEYNGMSEFIDVYSVYEDNLMVDIKELAEWTTDNSDVVVAYDGRLLAQGPGSAIVYVSYKGVTKEISVTVEKYIDLEALVEESQQARRIARTSDAERDSILAKASAMYNVFWTPTSNVRGWDGGDSYVAGQNYQGIPYSQTEYQKDDIGFMNVLNNDSTFYDDYVTPDGRIAPKYGNDCSGFVSIAFGVTRRNTTQFVGNIQNGIFPKVGNYDAYNPSYSDLYNSYASLQYGDAVVSGTKRHTFIIARNFGSSGTAYICYEQTPPSVQYTIWYRDVLANEKYMPFSKN